MQNIGTPTNPSLPGYGNNKKENINFLHINLNMIWKYFWTIMLVLQFLLFKSYCDREILTCIPEKMDQVGYINVSYRIYDLILKENIFQGLKFGVNNSLNGGMTLIGAFNLFLFGFSRFSLLIPNFFACFLCELLISKSLARITKSNCIPLVFCGLFLITEAIFVTVGGIFDYRWDFLAFCLYTIWLAYLLEYFYSDSKRAFYCSAIAGGILLFIRLNTVIYLGGALAIIVICTLLYSKANRKEIITDYIKYAGVLLLFGGWYLIINFRSFFDYYFSAVFTSPAKEAWKVHMKLADNLLYYPRLLWTGLMGKMQVSTILALSIFAVILFVLKKESFY